MGQEHRPVGFHLSHLRKSLCPHLADFTYCDAKAQEQKDFSITPSLGMFTPLDLFPRVPFISQRLTCSSEATLKRKEKTRENKLEMREEVGVMIHYIVTMTQYRISYRRAADPICG